MDKSVWWITLLLFLIVIVEESYRLHNPVSNVEDLIKRRNLRSVGYTHFDVSYLQERANDGVQPANILNSDNLRRRKRDAVSTSANIETTLHLEAHGDKFVLNVKHSDPVIHPNAKILFTDKDISRQWQGTNPDCFMTGKLTSHDAQTVVVSYCDNLKGYFHDANYTYWVESLEHYDPSSNASSRLLVARKPGGSDSWRSISSSEHEQIKEKVASKRAKRSEYEELQRLSRQKRQYAETKQADVTIELAIVHDEAATTYYDAGGATNDDERIEIVAMKWYGVAAEYSNPGAFYVQTTIDVGGGYTVTTTYDISVTIQVKAMEFWVSNPSYIAAIVNSNLQTYREDACTQMNDNNMFKEYDTIYIETGVDSSDARSGNAAAAGTCVDGQKCAISNLLTPTLYNLEMHELGHTLNMLHDFDDGASGTTNPDCIKPNHGIMGYKYNGWSPCSIRQLSDFVGTAEDKGKGACLWVENVNKSVISLESQWPGMVLTDDEVCARMNRPGWRYRSKPANNPPKCPHFTCVDMNIGSSSYGSFRGLGSYKGRALTNTIMGRRCGDNMYCYINNTLVRNQCIPWSATGLDDSVKTVRSGGWSAWGAETNCSRACGTGVQFRQRTCNNPTPMHSPWCEGSEYEATLCNTHPCPGDSTSPADLKTERASETCARLNANNLIGTAFENSGTKYSNHEHGQCEVKCDLKAGETADRTRFGLMPDGTPCSTSVTEDVFEKYNLPKSKGRLSRCLQGYCYIFGCDNKTATTLKSRDKCGVCGGTGSTCSVEVGSYNTGIADQGTIDLVTVPSGATNILIMYNFTGGGSPSYWIELWSEAGDEIIAKSEGGSLAITNNLDNPTQFAGTGWSFLSTAQFLSASGPTNENVTIKVYNSGGGTDGVIIEHSYSVPSDSSATTTSISPTTTTASATTECTKGASCSTGILSAVPPKTFIYLLILTMIRFLSIQYHRL